MRFREKLQLLKYVLFPAAGLVLILLYIRAAAADVVYSDYIRLINEYLPDVTDLSRMLTPDILTRIPACFLARLVNVSSFGYSVSFDRILSVIGLGLTAACLSNYIFAKEIRIGWQIVLWVVLFSLNKWEILLNGTAWAHMVSFGLFFISYLLLDLVWTGEASPRQEFLICAMPLVMLLFAGEYIVSYACTLILVCLMGVLTGGANSWAGRREQTIFRHVLVSAGAALLLYILSRSFAVWEHAGATELSLAEVVKSSPAFLPRFFLKTFAGAVIGQETIAAFFPGGAALPDALVIAAGAFVLGGYVLALFLYFHADLLEKTIFPLILLISGFANHLLVTAARWIFLREEYALSSRYAGQFMIGLLGMVLVFSMSGRQKRSYRREGQTMRGILRALTLLTAVFLLAGNLYTSWQEIRKAKYREANYEHMAGVLLEYEQYTPEELSAVLEWHKDPVDAVEAAGILRENRLNVFSRPHF